MKKTRIIKSEDEIIEDMLACMLECATKQKACIEALLEIRKEQKAMKMKDESVRKRKDCRLIHGVRELSKYLSCSRTKSQYILNSGVLQDKGIAYRVGTRWVINADMLQELLEDDPEFLGRRVA